ncbi:YbfB/YjiJ family MFS transporter [Pedobacter sp. MC2016-24]|uniref:YbfB/YjiJ family MFS transporter n=1 Tax=Pedobacter sp. MC2016-24 TaxID=2780090 RepID=UPI00187F24B9|nr:YbfB/YjiJ family MFS transporter [Pedobacter sp. MC2016-24]MBE9598632.1 YbfB/YjiJ family MFS transporter [Pedobacter sp. MC2016-24]
MDKELKRTHSLAYAFTGLVTLLIGIGIGRFGYPPLIPAIVNEKWFTIEQAGYLGAANLTGYIIGSVSATLLNRYVRSVTLIRIMLMLAAFTFLCCAFRISFPLYFMLRAIAGVTGGVLMVLTAPTLFKHTSKEKKGLIGGFIFSGVGIGIALSGTLIPLLVNHGLSITWFAYAIVAIALILVTWNGWPEGSNERQGVITVNQGSGVRFWNKTIILLIVSYASNAIGFVPHTVFWVDFVSRGLSLGIRTGTQLWVLLGLAAAIGPLLTGFIADRIGFAKSIRISLLIKAIGVVLPLISTSIWSLAISSIFVGSLALGISSLAAGRTAELVSDNLQKKVWSYMTVSYSIAHALTAYLLTYLFSVYGSYDMLFTIGAIALIIGSLTDYLSSKSAGQFVKNR